MVGPFTISLLVRKLPLTKAKGLACHQILRDWGLLLEPSWFKALCGRSLPRQLVLLDQALLGLLSEAPCPPPLSADLKHVI